MNDLFDKINEVVKKGYKWSIAGEIVLKHPEEGPWHVQIYGLFKPVIVNDKTLQGAIDKAFDEFNKGEHR